MGVELKSGTIYIKNQSTNKWEELGDISDAMITSSDNELTQGPVFKLDASGTAEFTMTVHKLTFRQKLKLFGLRFTLFEFWKTMKIYFRKRMIR